MAKFPHSSITAVLGPTNTGKTHLAVERLCAHASGVMGFPLRLLAREVYDRVVAIKGEALVGLITGEEKTLPPRAKYLLTTVESMPVDQKAAFVAVDEVQLGSDPERGHVFTDRLLRARGYAETMFLGSDSMSGLVRNLVPEAEIIGRPRFSTLSYGGHKKLSRLPRRSAIVAFSAEEVYAIAEALRRLRGGAAVVMGALSPRTRNAQVAMFQAGEVDYLVATDAIGMGLNLNVNHVAFASLNKFDGRRSRRLTIPEMAQIAGRAGRHQQDGTFGTVGNEGALGFTPEEIEAIEEHHFPKLGQLYWRKGDPSMESVDDLIVDLEQVPDRRELIPAPQAVDLAVLKRLAEEPDVIARATNKAMVKRLWDVCGVPDFLKMGADHHARLIHRLWQYRSGQSVDGGKSGGLAGHVDGGWFADQLARLDRTDGDVDTLAARIAGVRTWCYIAHRPDWLLNASEMAERARGVEARLSDALHERLTQRFVDRRTSVLLRALGEGEKALAVVVTGDNAVLVEGEEIGTLKGFRFVVDKSARASDHKLLLAAAEKHLSEEYAQRAASLAQAPDAELILRTEAGALPVIVWQDEVVAELTKGSTPLSPVVTLTRDIRNVTNSQQQEVIRVRLATWLDAQIAKYLEPLVKAQELARSPESSGELRGFLAQFVDQGGIAARNELDSALRAMSPEDRTLTKPLGLAVGSIDLFLRGLLKPEPARWRLAMLSIWQAKPMGVMPDAGAVRIVSDDEAVRDGAKAAGFRALGSILLRIDMAERVARNAHEQRLAAEQALPEAERRGRTPFALDDTLPVSLGLDSEAQATLFGMLGFRPAHAPEPNAEDAIQEDAKQAVGAEVPTNASAEEAAGFTAIVASEIEDATASDEPVADEVASGEATKEEAADFAAIVAAEIEAATPDNEAVPEAGSLAVTPTTDVSESEAAQITPAPEAPRQYWTWHGRVREQTGRGRADNGRPQNARRRPNFGAQARGGEQTEGRRDDGGRPQNNNRFKGKKRRDDNRPAFQGQRGQGQGGQGQRGSGSKPAPRNLEHSPFAALADLLPGKKADKPEE